MLVQIIGLFELFNESPLQTIQIGFAWFPFLRTLEMSAGGGYNYSYIFKYIIVGEMGVGKSCLMHQFTEKKCKLHWNK